MSASYLVVAMDDDHNGHPTFCADENAVIAAVRDCMFMEGVELDHDESEQVAGSARALIENGALHFEGDPSIYLFRMSDLRGPTYPQDDAPRAAAAVKTLEGKGYTYHGGELWKPPLGPNPFEPREYQKSVLEWARNHPVIVAPKAPPACWCERCRPITLTDMRMVVCSTCHNKRCPRASWHGYKCSGSNDVGQVGEPE